MIKLNDNICIIPARGGSKGIPRKNIKLFNNKPLIFWTIKAALESNYIDRVIVSTEDEEIADIALGMKEGSFFISFTKQLPHSQDFTDVFRRAVSFPVLDPVNGAGVTSCLLAARRSGKPCMIIERKSRY